MASPLWVFIQAITLVLFTAADPERELLKAPNAGNCSDCVSVHQVLLLPSGECFTVNTPIQARRFDLVERRFRNVSVSNHTSTLQCRSSRSPSGSILLTLVKNGDRPGTVLLVGETSFGDLTSPVYGVTVPRHDLPRDISVHTSMGIPYRKLFQGNSPWATESALNLRRFVRETTARYQPQVRNQEPSTPISLSEETTTPQDFASRAESLPETGQEFSERNAGVGFEDESMESQISDSLPVMMMEKIEIQEKMMITLSVSQSFIMTYCLHSRGRPTIMSYSFLLFFYMYLFGFGLRRPTSFMIMILIVIVIHRR